MDEIIDHWASASILVCFGEVPLKHNRQNEKSPEQLQLRSLIFGNYGLGRALIYTLVFKVAIFAIGVLLIGVLATRTGLASNSSGGYQVFGLDQWPHVEAYTDFRDLYMKDLVAPFLQGHDPYQLGTIVYNYPPLFLYLLSFFAQVNIVWFPAIPLAAFDILTTIPVYLIAKQFLFRGNSKMAFAVAIIWAVNPINLFYNDLMWLNPGPTTFFLMMGIYYFLKRDWYFSAFMLAVSTGFKQITVLAVPVLLILLWNSSAPKKIAENRVRQIDGKKDLVGNLDEKAGTIQSSLSNFRKDIRRALVRAGHEIWFGLILLRPIVLYLATFVGFLFIISLPYIVTEPQNYFYSLQLPIFGYPPGTSAGYPSTFSYDLSQPTRITTFLGLLNFTNLQSVAVTSYQLLDYAFAFAYVALLIYILYAKLEPSGTNTLILVMTGFLVFFGLYGRGIYKYYFATLTPLALPFLGEKKQMLIFEGLSLAILFVPRVATPWMAVLLLTLLPRFLNRSSNQSLETAGSGDLPPT